MQIGNNRIWHNFNVVALPQFWSRVLRNRLPLIFYEYLLSTTLWSLFMDRVQPCQGYRATRRRLLTFYHSVPMSPWCLTDQPQKDERPGWPWSCLCSMVLSLGPLNWKSAPQPLGQYSIKTCRHTCLSLYPITLLTSTKDEKSSGNGTSKIQNQNTKKCKLKLESMLGLTAVRAYYTMLYNTITFQNIYAFIVEK